MRHRQSRLRLRQKPAHSRSLQRNILTSLLLYEAIRTTKKRAEVIRPNVDRLITAAKTKDPQAAIRYINRTVMDKNASKKLMEVLKQRYAKRSSGYTRMVPLGARVGDGAELVTLELMDRDLAVAAPSEAPAKKAATKKPSTKKPAAKKAETASAPASTDSSTAS